MRARRGARPARPVATAALLLAAACSGEGTSDPTQPEQPVASVPADDGDPAASAGDPADDPAGRAEADAATITMSVRSDVVDGEIAVELDAGGDPFGAFGSCSGLRAGVATYSALVSSVAGPVRSISLLTTDTIDGPGTHDADVRIEPDDGSVVTATGTVTLDDSLTGGSYVAFTPDGTRVEGDFTCGGGPGPVPLTMGADDGVLDSIEVVALVRDGDAERVLGLAVTGEALPSARCPGATGSGDDALLVSVDGDRSVGALTGFELTGDPSPAMRLRAGTASYEIANAEVSVDSGATTGTFSGTTADGVTVDGAFRCT